MICAAQRLENRLSPSFEGLYFKDGVSYLDKKFFSCCDAQGFFYDQKREAQAVCNLKRRLLMTQKLAQSFEETWQAPSRLNSDLLSSTEIAFLRQALEQYRSGKDKRGHAFTTFSKASEPSIKLWQMALFASWHYALPAHVITLAGRSSLNTAFLTRGEDNPLIFIEQKGAFLNAEIAVEFSAIVNWCDQHEIGLWIDLFQEAPKTVKKESPASDAMTAFQRRIDAQNAKPPLRWIHADCKSRLENICKNTHLYL